MKIKDQSKPWREYTPKEIYAIVCRDCTYCKYSLGVLNDKDMDSISCDYLRKQQERRPCMPGQCRRHGVFQAKYQAVEQE